MKQQICGAMFCSCAIKPVSILKLYKTAVLPWRSQLQTQTGHGGQLVKRCQAEWKRSGATGGPFQNKSIAVATVLVI